jgi:hypothetical protein
MTLEPGEREAPPGVRASPGATRGGKTALTSWDR